MALQTNTPVRSVILIAAALCVAACSPSPSFQLRYAPTPVSTPEHDRLTANELARFSGVAPDAYSALQQIRPVFLTTRPGAQILRGETSHIHVLFDGMYGGDVDVLKLIPTKNIESIRRVQAAFLTVPIGQVRPGDTVLMVHLR